MPPDQGGKPSRWAAVPDHVAWRPLAGETVMLDLRTGVYHGLNHVAARFLEVSISTSSAADAATALAEEFEQSGERIGADLRAFVADMTGRGLMVVHEHE